MLVQNDVHIDMMVIIIMGLDPRVMLLMHAFTWLMIYLILHLVKAIFILTKLEFICISHIL